MDNIRQQVKFNDNYFKFYPVSNYCGTSIITGTKWKKGEAIYWCKGVGGFPLTEWFDDWDDEIVEPTEAEMKLMEAESNK